MKNTLKNMEIIFTVAAAIACSASYVSFMQPPAANTAQAASSASMPVVTISAKRMTAEEKQISLMQERQALLTTPAIHTL
ncbi:MULTISPECIES: hypothetical protein [unclassified Janthinobacterium]|uniref:hypothetical protein n=1 Tax=unclassified Janthinobacterium TaxID=2610881 RepID=UPI00161E5169|nr:MULTISPECIES: hypothetical protein [unclassified Janthinobacterium]MBB5368759.1 hypothetical protein [Janthinobacterium sp. K2C7]MBB5381705.1 hypothetical protein [Janthinobacterium sp. K2Li3]MBB5387141.1 hypothetical protein [Janthinobacterium sp. K2E3]